MEKAQTKVWTPTGTRQNKVDRVRVCVAKLYFSERLYFQMSFAILALRCFIKGYCSEIKCLRKIFIHDILRDKYLITYCLISYF